MNEYDVGQAIDELMVLTSLLNQTLAEVGWPLITLPQRSAAIKPFFDDMVMLINRMHIELEKVGNG